MSLKAVSLLSCSLCLAACSAVPQSATLSDTKMAPYQQVRLVLKQQDTSAFSYSSQSEMIAARALGAMSPVSGIVSAAAGIRAATRGSEIQKSLQLTDPAKGIEQALATRLQRQYGLDTQSNNPQTIELDVRTTQWRPVYQLSTKRYSLDYQADMNLMQGEQQLSKGTCVYKTPAERQAISFAMILANGATWLKQETEQAIQHCDLTLIKSS